MERDGTGMRSGLSVMLGLVGLVKPLAGFMCLAVLMGSAGNLCATFITVAGGSGLLGAMGLDGGLPLKTAAIIMVAFAVVRAALRYTEQSCNHYIAFRLLARIRHEVFAKLRQLAPAKLEGRDRGNLISVITTDIELLEVFYAHTLSPIAIAVITSVVMTVFVGRLDTVLCIIAVCGYLTVGLVIPIVNSRAGGGAGQEYRDRFGELNTIVLDNLRGLDEILQFRQGKARQEKMQNQAKRLTALQRRLKSLETLQVTLTDAAVMFSGAVCLAVSALRISSGSLDFASGLLATVAVMSSFGPTAALAAVSNNLHQTLASGRRVLDLLEEEPQVEEICDGQDFCSGDIAVENVDFAYGTGAGRSAEVRRQAGVPVSAGRCAGDGEAHAKTGVASGNAAVEIHGTFEKDDSFGDDRGYGRPAVHRSSAAAKYSAGDGRLQRNGGTAASRKILSGFSVVFREGRITGILGRSGCGKSTLLKLMMRFFETGGGAIRYGGRNISDINTADLRRHIAYVEQETFLFHDTVRNNIRLGMKDVTDEQIEAAARKASLHDFVMRLPDGYDTRISELGDSLSGGERQRIGIARAFLHDPDVILLDEPTSNLDSLNESVILKALKEEADETTVVLVSHRKSTMGIADEVLQMNRREKQTR